MLRLRDGVALSIALHGTLLAVLSRATLHDRAPPERPHRQDIIWLVTPAASIEATSELPSRSEPPPPRVESRKRKPRSAEAAEQPEPASLTPPAATESAEQKPRTSPPDRGVDLTEALERAAQEIRDEREKATSYRSFAFVGTIADQEAFDDAERLRRAERGLQQPLTVFDSPSKGRAGLAAKNALGQYVRWVSDDCYQVFGTGNLFLDQEWPVANAVPATLCQRLLPRGDLFATSKPSYLMDGDELAESQKADERFERLRRPTTGVAMPLAE